MSNVSPSEIAGFLEKLREQCEPLEKKTSDLYWKFSTTGEEGTAKRLAEVEKEYKILFSNRDAFNKIRGWKKEGIKDPGLARQIDLLIQNYIPNQLDEKTIEDLVLRQTEIENIFNNFRSELNGKKISLNDIKEILKKEKDSPERQKAWEATKQIGPEVAERVKELVLKRNKAARGLGFSNHFEMSLELQELDGRWLFGLFGDLKRATQNSFQNRIGRLHEKLSNHYQISKEAVMPWHYDDPFAQAAPSQVTVDLDPYLQNKDITKILSDFYDGIGLNITDVLERSDLYEKNGKSQHAFCITMDRTKKDVRVLANIRPNSYWASTMLHELGHAAYSKNIDVNLPYFLRDEAHIFATEAIAMLMERMIHHPHWLQQMLDLPLKEIRGLKDSLWDSLKLDKLIIVRWIMLVTHFEKELYGNPDQNLNDLWWNLVWEYQLIQKPKGRDLPDWAAKIHIPTAPVYYQNYLLGELMAAQIAEMLEREALPKSLNEISFCGIPGVGQLLKEKMFQMGRLFPWTRLTPHVTGHPLESKSFIRQFCF